MTITQGSTASHLVPEATSNVLPLHNQQDGEHMPVATSDHCSSPDKDTTAKPKDIPASPFHQTLLSYVQQFTRAELSEDGSSALKQELVTLLEGVVRVLREDSTAQLGVQSAEIEELRRSLIEAKDTIIKLLTERVKDHALIARLETELKFLPDLQAQADKALNIASEAGDFREELTKLRFELNKAHLSRVRDKLHKRHRRKSWWSRACAYILRQDVE